MTIPHNPYAQQQPGYGFPPPPAPPAPRNGFGITALCLALTGLVFGIVPFTGFIALILGALALLFGLLSLGRVRKGLATNKVMSVFGSVLGAGALALGLLGVVLFFQAVDSLSNGLKGASVASVAPPGQEPTSSRADTPAVAAFGATQKWDSGVEVTVQPPKAFRPSQYAAGADRARAVSFDVLVKNGSDAPLELSSLMIEASFNGQMVTQIFDSEKNMLGAPSTSVLPGKTSKFSVAFPSDREKGEMQIEVTPGFSADRSYFTGQV